MSENVSFIQGSKENYNPSEMAGGVFFSKDTKEILLNGESYGNSVKADEEDITQEEGNLKLKDRSYDKANFSGMGKKILRKNIVDSVNTLTQSMMQATNTIYVIQYEFTLGEDITVPENCVLKFEGGLLKNGTLVGNDTKIIGNYIFESIVFTGTWFADTLNVTSTNFVSINLDNVAKAFTKNTLNLFCDIECNFSGSHIHINGNGNCFTGNIIADANSDYSSIEIDNLSIIGYIHSENQNNSIVINRCKIKGNVSCRYTKDFSCNNTEFYNDFVGEEGQIVQDTNVIYLYDNVGSVDINKCTFKDLFGGAIQGIRQSKTTYVSIKDCVFSRLGMYCIMFSGGIVPLLKVEGNTFKDCNYFNNAESIGGEFIYGEALNSHGFGTAIIRNNVFDCVYGGIDGDGGTSDKTDSERDDRGIYYHFYNNIVTNCKYITFVNTKNLFVHDNNLMCPTKTMTIRARNISIERNYIDMHVAFNKVATTVVVGESTIVYPVIYSDIYISDNSFYNLSGANQIALNFNNLTKDSKTTYGQNRFVGKINNIWQTSIAFTDGSKPQKFVCEFEWKDTEQRIMLPTSFGPYKLLKGTARVLSLNAVFDKVKIGVIKTDSDVYNDNQIAFTSKTTRLYNNSAAIVEDLSHDLIPKFRSLYLYVPKLSEAGSYGKSIIEITALPEGMNLYL